VPNWIGTGEIQNQNLLSARSFKGGDGIDADEGGEGSGKGVHTEGGERIRAITQHAPGEKEGGGDLRRGGKGRKGESKGNLDTLSQH